MSLSIFYRICAFVVTFAVSTHLFVICHHFCCPISLHFTTAFALLSVAVAVSTHLFVICHHFCCPISLYFTTAFALLSVAVAVSIRLCVICHHFCCPMSLPQQGLLYGSNYLVPVDHCSDYFELEPLGNTLASTVIRAIKRNFARAEFQTNA